VNPDLEKWIDEASKGLEPLAREKITEQINEHYEDSVAGYRSSGLSEVDACSRALADLGSAVLAANKYKSIYFGIDEVLYARFVQYISLAYFTYLNIQIILSLYYNLKIGNSAEYIRWLENMPSELLNWTIINTIFTIVSPGIFYLYCRSVLVSHKKGLDKNDFSALIVQNFMG